MYEKTNTKIIPYNISLITFKTYAKRIKYKVVFNQKAFLKCLEKHVSIVYSTNNKYNVMKYGPHK